MNVEHVFTKVLINNLTIIICAVYIPPNSHIQLYLNHFTVIESLESTYPNCKFIICGDYNLSSLTWVGDKSGFKCSNFIQSPPGRSLIECFSILNLVQFNNFTNSSGNVLDLIYSNFHDTITEPHIDPLVPVDLCHPALQIVCKLPTYTPNLKNNHTIFSYNKGDYINANLFFNSFNWFNTFNSLNMDTAANLFHDALLKALSSFVPQKIVNNNKKFPCWFNKELITLVWKKKKAHSIYTKTMTKSNYEIFSNFRSQYKSKSKTVFMDFMRRSERTINSNPKQFWNWVSCNTRARDIPHSIFSDDKTADNGEAIAELFSSYFSSVYRTSVIPPLDKSFSISSTQTFEHVLPSHCTISLDEVSDGLRSLCKSKSPGPDGISGYFLSNLSDSIAYPVYLLFNKSLELGIFPSIWKISSITPVYKKGDKSNVKNYRPIAGLVQVGKLLEKLVLNHIIKPINNILDNSQHGFRLGRSTISCNLTLQHFILESFKNNCQVDVIYTDFEKAFDRVDHKLLIIALDQLGIGEPLLSWFYSYLTNRSQFTKVLGYSSKLLPVSSGTPQGGHLSPILFNLFINGISSVLKNCHFLFFADDLKIYSRISSINDCLILQEELNILYNWCQAWGMSLNINKCHSMCFYRSREHIHYIYSVNNNLLKSVSSIKDLGIILTHNLNFQEHIENIVKKSLRVLGFVKRHSSDFKDLQSFKLLYCALVRPVLEYGSPIWSPYTKSSIDSIEGVQNRFLKFIAFKFNLTFTQHDYSSVRSFLNLPTLASRRDLADISFLYKLLNTLIDAPYLLRYIQLNVPAYNNRTSPLFYLPPLSTNYLKNSPLPRAMALCNKLDPHIDFFYSSLDKIHRVYTIINIM